MNALLIRSRDAYEDALRRAFPNRAFSPEEMDQLYACARDVDSYRIEANPAAALGLALNVVPKIAELLNRMSWVRDGASRGGELLDQRQPFILHQSRL